MPVDARLRIWACLKVHTYLKIGAGLQVLAGLGSFEGPYLFVGWGLGPRVAVLSGFDHSGPSLAAR